MNISFLRLSAVALIALLLFALGLAIVVEWLRTGLLSRFPTAILATDVVILASLLGTVGLVLQIVPLGRREVRRLIYLQIPLSPRNADPT